MSTALLELKSLRREFPSGEETITVLKDLDLTIESGEMVAIVGASGSGKSTLMNILGCLDRPSSGSYRVAGRQTRELAPDELAQLRREHFGFVFQRYHLLPDLTALGNVEIPAIYAGKDRAARCDRAAALLDKLGLADRMDHRPGQLSGGQQQRVSIARALMNGCNVILADEPTGALDRHSGQAVMAILKELNAEGHTVIIVTHDMQIAEHARRIIEISDGEIIADRENTQIRDEAGAVAPHAVVDSRARQAALWRADWDRLTEAFKMALLAMAAHRLRTFLTMLGIIIGIASVVSVVALGQGSRQRILKDISSLGTNTIDIYPGKDFGDMRSSRVQTLRPADATALAAQPYIDSVTPRVSSSVVLRYGNVSVNATVNGVGEQYFRVRGMEMADGTIFDAAGIRSLAQEVVIDDNTRKKLFPGNENPLGAVVFLGSVPCRVIGAAKAKDSGFGNNDSLNLFAPYTTVMTRLLGQTYLKGMTVRISDAVPTDVAEQGVTRMLSQRHGAKDFFVSNTDSIRKTIEKTTATMTLLVSMIALISLVVGGIGVMNIMLVSVTERTQEIGVRMAVGARQGDIMRQFLIEAVLVCLLGGAIGVGLSLAFGAIFARASSNFAMVYSTASIVAAFAVSTAVGVAFGFLPARNAARLDPVVALSRE
ncbi:MacB family efflux pump subunit [Niveibacterium terrae]|uniref:MacB family efflux pump subunit n=1 Tax=Niveibacterium terrae TaxID=3373598 RepID=UPI003A8EC2F0